jgi:hypothetical protein
MNEQLDGHATKRKLSLHSNEEQGDAIHQKEREPSGPFNRWDSNGLFGLDDSLWRHLMSSK